MPTPPVSDEVLHETVQAYLTAGKVQTAAADTLGISRNALQNRLKHAARRGLFGPGEALPGYEITATSTTYDRHGEVSSQSFTQKPEAGGKFNVPTGHVVKGVSTLVDSDGNVRAQWYKTREGERDPDDVAQIIERAFENFTPRAPAIRKPLDNDEDRLTVYVFCDWHVGLFAYGRETGGPDWDLAIARKTIADSVAELVEASPPSQNAIVLGLGDLLHADNGRNQTERSGNVLDVDTRYSKCLETVCDLLVDATERIVAKHELVELTFKPGNHDENSTTGIRQALRMYWRDTGRVSVDTSPDAFYWRRFGVNLIGGTHGDKAKPNDLPLIMANRRKEDWAVTSTRHCHTGHIHHDTLKEIGGVHVFSHRAPVAQDAYHASYGYLGGRSLKSFTYHVEKGARGHTEIEIA